MMTRSARRIMIGSVAAAALGNLGVSPGAGPTAHAQRQAAPLAAGACTQTKSHAQVGLVSTISGGLTVRHGTARAKPAAGKTPLHRGDVLSTKANQGASVQLCDGSMVYLHGSTQISLRTVTDVVETHGEIAEVLKKTTAHHVHTPTGEASAKDALFDVAVRGQRGTFVDGRGLVKVQNKLGIVGLKQNQETTTALAKAPGTPTKVDALRTLAWTAPLSWQVLTAPNLLSSPQRVALDPLGNLYVTDKYNNRVVKLSPAGSVLATWGTPGTGPGDPASLFPEPAGIALDATGNVYVTDATSQVKKLSPSGQLLLSWGNCGPPDCTDVGDPRVLNGPWSVTLDGAGHVYVADGVNNRIVMYAPDGHPLMTFGVPTPPGQLPGTDPGVMSDPQGVAVDGAGNVYAADTLNNRIQKFSPDGQPLAQWGSKGDQPGQFSEPTDLTIDSKGNIYVADSGNNRIQELSAAGKWLATYDTNSVPKIGGFVSPEGVALDAQGNMYVVDRSPGRIWKYTPPR
jgi:sugar lactone lactonase YvrE